MFVSVFFGGFVNVICLLENYVVRICSFHKSRFEVHNFLSPFNWNAFNLDISPLVNCGLSSPYASLLLITASWICSLNLFGQFGFFHKICRAFKEPYIDQFSC